MIAYMKKTISKVAAAIVVAVLSSAILTSCDPEKGDKTIAVSGVSINKTSINLAEGDSETLSATLSPAEATNKSVSWSSSDIGVAMVDYSGKVTGDAFALTISGLDKMPPLISVVAFYLSY